MSKVFTAFATSVDGYITGPNPSPEAPLGTGGTALFDWYGGGDTPSDQFPDFKLSRASAEVFDATAARVGAVIAGRTTYDHSGGWGGGGPHQTFVATGIVDAIARAADAAGDGDVALMGSGNSEVVAAINAAIPGTKITLPDGRNPNRPPDNYLDITRLRTDTGFRPEYDVEGAVPDYVDWLRRHDR